MEGVGRPVEGDLVRVACKSAQRRRSNVGRRPVVGRLRRRSSTRRECRERWETDSRGEEKGCIVEGGEMGGGGRSQGRRGQESERESG